MKEDNNASCNYALRPHRRPGTSPEALLPDESGVKAANLNILTLPVDALAIPANLFGFTDSGVDMAISQKFSTGGLQDTLRLQIDRDHDGELLAGQALVLPTKSTRLRYVVVAQPCACPPMYRAA
ncbi:MAG: hypothetical protein U0074_12310 [Kouleothrix sp.]